MLARGGSSAGVRPSLSSAQSLALAPKPIRVATLCQHQRLNRPVVATAAAAMVGCDAVAGELCADGVSQG